MAEEVVIRVCLIEDDKDVISAAQLRFRRERRIHLDVIEVDRAEQLASLPDMILSGNYHVLLVDLGLPSAYPLSERWRAGLDLLTALDERSCRAVPVVLTGYDQEENHIEAARRGARTLIAKKGSDVWSVLPVQVRAAYAYWLCGEEVRRRQMMETELAKKRLVMSLAAGQAHDLKGPAQVFEFVRDAVCRAAAEGRGLDPDITRLLCELMGDAVESNTDTGRYLSDVLHDRPLEPRIKQEAWAPLAVRLGRAASAFSYQQGRIAQASTENRFEGMVCLDRRMVYRAVCNLFMNALAAMEKQGMAKGTGVLRLRSYAEADSLVIAIEDNAGGIPAEAFANSSGLGLGICKRIVEEIHGGTMSHKSLNDIGGTTFTLRVPLQQPVRPLEATKA